MPRRASTGRTVCAISTTTAAEDACNAKSSPKPSTASQRVKPTMQAIAEIEKKRKNRRKAMEKAKKDKEKETIMLEKLGQPGDLDFQRMIKCFREQNGAKKMEHEDSGETKITICVRKRPVNAKEAKKKDFDAVTCLNPMTIVHECKLRVDGITKYLDSNAFSFDHTFDEAASTELVYMYTAQPLIEFVCNDGGRATVFAYGQTGSGKTYTMQGIQNQVASDIFSQIEAAEKRGIHLRICVSFFEIYGGHCQDLLHRKRLTIREDGCGEVQIMDLQEVEPNDKTELLQIMQKGNSLRTTHATEVNDVSSRSHCICQLTIRDGGDDAHVRGKLSLIDLAGSERGADSTNHDKQRRLESSEINKSLLALKECFRALDNGGRGTHIPFRASKLTQVLKDSFMNAQARTVMIATVSPCSSSSDHTLNTLRYADRAKEKHVAFDTLSFEDSPAIDNSDEQAGNTQNQTSEEEDLPAEVVLSRDAWPEDTPSISSPELGPCQGTVQTLYEKQESFFNAHMSAIQESAELLTEEGSLLAEVQKDSAADRELLHYMTRLDQIFSRKADTIQALQNELAELRRHTTEEQIDRD